MAEQTKVLLVEDEEKLANFLLRGLRAEGFDCQWLDQLAPVSTTLAEQQIDLLICDRMLGDLDALSLLPKIRSRHPTLMILMLTALDEVEERVNGLQAGADDYLCKPFDFDELLARIQSLLRRSHQQADVDDALKFGTIRLYEKSQRVFVAEQEVDFTKLEFELLRYFLKSPQQLFTRERILSRVWGNQSDPLTNVVDVYVRRLRKKIDRPQEPSFIETLRGSGYRLNRQSQ